MAEAAKTWRPNVIPPVDYRHPGLLTRFLGLPDGKGFVAGVQRLAAEAESLDAVTTESAGRLMRAYRIGHTTGLGDALVGGYLRALTIADCEAGALTELRRFAMALGIDLDWFEHNRVEALTPLYSGMVDTVLADHQTTQEEWDGLKHAAKVLELPDEAATAVYAAAVKVLFDAKLEEVLADGELSPDEDKDMMAMFDKVRIDPRFTPNVEAHLAEARQTWAIAHLPLPAIECSALLQRGEIAYAETIAEAMELRSRTSRVNYGGPVARIRIMKGVSYRLGSVQMQRETEDYWHSFGHGHLIITSKRVLFTAPERSISLPYRSIIGIEHFADAITLTKGSGKPLTLMIPGKPKTLSQILDRARADG